MKRKIRVNVVLCTAPGDSISPFQAAIRGADMGYQPITDVDDSSGETIVSRQQPVQSECFCHPSRITRIFSTFITNYTFEY
jgi:hypothetical protein